MGCDIHIVLEKKSGCRWIGVDTFAGHESSHGKGWNSPAARSRNYGRFAALAGVRGEGPAPRGLPDFPSDTTALLLEEYGQDAHSVSWLPIDEAAQIFSQTQGVLKDDDFALRYPESYFFGVDTSDHSSWGEYRIVFWFDN